jgi:hypothetical protein
VNVTQHADEASFSTAIGAIARLALPAQRVTMGSKQKVISER